MRNVVVIAVLYTGLALGANATDLTGLLVGDMQKMVVTDPPKDLPAVELLDLTDAPQTLAQYRGKWVLVNFWATWCAPCRLEMPSLGRLAKARPDLVVLPLSTGRNPVPQIQRFIEQVDVAQLPHLRDPSMKLSAQIGILGLPVTIVLNPQGQEVARLIGDAAWDDPATLRVLDAITATR